MRQGSTIRMRLTLWYGSMFLVTGVILLTVLFVLVRNTIDQGPESIREQAAEVLGVDPDTLPDFGRPGDRHPPPTGNRTPFDNEDVRRVVDNLRQRVVDDTLQSLLIQSAIAIGAMAVVSFALGWIVAGRMLRPLQKITETARRLSDATLHKRINLDGPNDELKELADTFDEMLERLDAAFGAQRDFVANASHEIRTPLTIMRTAIDVTLDDPDATVADYRDTAVTIRAAIDRADALTDALLVLAQAEAAPLVDEIVDLSEVIEASLHRLDAAGADIDTMLDVGPAIVRGDRELLERLADNLIENAITYNVDAGWIKVSTSSHDVGADNRAQLRVTNSGPIVAADSVDQLFERFERVDHSRSRATGGFGLGLSIVAAIARLHNAEIHAAARPEGGLDISVDFPAASSR